MHEHWTYVYSDSIYATPIISLAAGNDRAIEELEYVYERGAKIFLIRVAPVPTWKGRKSFALPEFDPFWARVQELDIVVGMHSGDGDDPQRYINEWDGIGSDPLPFKQPGVPAFSRLAVERASSRTAWRRSSATGWPPASPAEVHARRVPGDAGCDRSSSACRKRTTTPPYCSKRIRSRSLPATSTSTPSTSRTRRGCSTWVSLPIV